MDCGTPLCFFKPVLAVAAVAGVGMAGYNLATTGCPLGSCSAGGDAVTSILASQTAEDTPKSCCPVEAAVELTLVADEATKDSCCPESSDEASVELVAATDAETCDVDACETACEEPCELGEETELVADGEPASDGADG